ncbi:MAG: MGMT family protein [Bacteroidota bacterium]
MSSVSHTYEKIYRLVAKIPRGKVATYGQIARLAGIPNGARQVGYALHAIPPGFPIPWQRVINSRGTISFPRAHRNHALQRRLLEKERVRFTGGVVDLKKFGWRHR